jgi:Zn finger protein HypA/HybF involved in hydrogenase expression
MSKDYDVVIDTLQKQRAILWKMTDLNMNADMFNVMDQIRLEQIDQLDKAIIMWEKNKCWCHTCRPNTLGNMRMILCPNCGNKRCPRATNHTLECTNSNEPGQEGSVY